MSRTAIILSLGSGSTDEVKVDTLGWALSLKLSPSDSETESHTPPSYVRPGMPFISGFSRTPCFPAGPGQLVNAVSLLLGGRWEDGQAARTSRWLLNRGFEDLFISD